MSLYGGIEDHPDLNDADWGRRVEREFNRERRGKRGVVVGFVAALAVTGLVAGGLLVGGVAEGPAHPASAVDFDRPFAGTEFETWADGEKGVVAASEHEQVRKAVVAARLDPAVLVGHDPSAFLSLVPAEAREAWMPILPTLVTRLKQGTTLLPGGIKVKGTIAPAVDDEGVDVVRSDYLIAYAFAPADRTAVGGPEDFVVLLHAIADYRLIPQGLQIRTTKIRIDHAACSTKTDGYLAPQFAGGSTCGVSA
ncbi:hypothetical protein [Lentzea flaviverrucosa]|uniref:Uncharacterized protein n=1 Tax=Lentzea flaviverrucosa TaxID=200379 RepID=A0A1H9XQR9_9PSEU|nr:hypothetical protein [Lentzea flaviverrucosa]RDI19725.1 hypothetical protein DFR72_11679 [Lentzea flaviverrucosa]SES48043.1 hypothetical protein SAMN05216195_11679 [Lentzea flaviverrucosa]